MDSLLEKDFRMFPLPLERVLSALMEVVSAEVVELLPIPLLDFLTEEDELDEETSPVGGFPAARLPVGEVGRLSALSLSSEDSPSPLCPSSNTMDGPEGGWLSNAFFTWDFLPEARTIEDLDFRTRAALDGFLTPVESADTMDDDLDRRMLPD